MPLNLPWILLAGFVAVAIWLDDDISDEELEKAKKAEKSKKSKQAAENAG